MRETYAVALIKEYSSNQGTTLITALTLKFEFQSTDIHKRGHKTISPNSVRQQRYLACNNHRQPMIRIPATRYSHMQLLDFTFPRTNLL